MLQVEPSCQQILATIIQIWVNDKRNANFLIKIVGINGTALYDTGANMSCMSYTCYAKLKDPPPLMSKHALSAPSATGYVLCLMDLIHFGNMLDNTQFIHTFIVCQNLQIEHAIGLERNNCIIQVAA